MAWSENRDSRPLVNKSVALEKLVRSGRVCGIGALVENTPANLAPGSVVIPTRSRRQAMDWSLALASQGIAATIVHEPEGDRWSLAVDAPDSQRAFVTLKQYHIENRGWRWEQPLPWTEAMFHWGGLVWCLFLIFVHELVLSGGTQLRRAGVMDNVTFWSGEWWRLFTAVTLHADWSHLISNLTTGFLLFGLVMARYGAGPGLLAAFLAGAGGNLAGALLYAKPYHGLGASGMVMGALGLLAGGAISHWRARRIPAPSTRVNAPQPLTRSADTLPMNRKVGRVAPCAPPSASDGPDGAHGVPRPTTALGSREQPVSRSEWNTAPSVNQILASLAGGLMLFLLLGADPNSDMIAHLGGFVTGCLLGALLGAIPAQAPHRRSFNAFSLVGLVVLLFCVWWRALL